MNKKVVNVLEAAIIVVVGVLIAIFGPSAVDTYFGIVAVVIASLLFILLIVTLARTKLLDLTSTFLAPVLMTLGVALLAHWLSFAALVYFVVYILMGIGFGIVIYGIYALSKKATVIGVTDIILGALLVVFTILFLTVDGFQQAFWIVVGVLIALYGAFFLVSTLLDKKVVKAKKKA